MTSRELIEFICDRCGDSAVSEGKGLDPFNAWGSIGITTIDYLRDRKLPEIFKEVIDNRTVKHICPNCLTEYLEWWKKEKKKVQIK